MKCSFCHEAAKFKCACIEPYMCTTHLGSHLNSIKKHPYEDLDIEIEEYRLKEFKSHALKTLKIISDIKTEISLKTKSLISLLNKKHKQLTEQLDGISQTFIELLHFDKFCESDVQKFYELESSKVTFKIIETDLIIKEIKSIYCQEFITCSNKSEFTEKNFLNNHTGGFPCGAIIDDGRTLVTGGHDSTIRVWDLVQKKQKFVLHGHNSDVKCLTLTGDSQYIISGSYDASVRVWNIKERKQVALLKGHTGAVWAICYEDENSLIISGGSDRELIFWNFWTLTVFYQTTLQSEIYSFAFANFTRRLVIGLNSDIMIFTLENLNILNELKGHSGPVICLALANDQLKFVSGSFDNTIIIWDFFESKQIFKLSGHIDYIRSIALSLDNDFIVSGSDDKTVKIWSMQNGILGKNYDQESYVKCVLNYHHNFLLLNFNSSFGELDVMNQTISSSYFLEPFNIFSVNIVHDRNLIGYGVKNKVNIWDINQNKIKYSFEGHSETVMYVEISKDGKNALSCSSGQENNLIYWNLVSGKKIISLEGHRHTVYCACFSKNNTVAASGSEDKTIGFWNLKESKKYGELEGHTASIRSIKFIDSKNLLVSGGEDNKVIVWNLIDGRPCAVLGDHNNLISKILITDDEQFIISGNIYEGIFVWNTINMNLELKFSLQDEAAEWLENNGIKIGMVKQYLKLRNY